MSVYTQMVRMSDYLYKIEYPSLDYEHAYRYFRNHFDVGSVLGACSAVYSDNGFFGKNMDIVYDESVSFVVVNRFGNYDTIGIAGGIPELTREVVENEEYTPMYRVLPFMLNSGMNSAGVYAGLNTVYSGDAGETTGTNPTSHRRVNVLMLVRYLLDRCGTAKEAVWKLQLLDIYCPHTVDRNEEYHLMIGDKDECYAVEFIDNKVVVTQLAEHKWLTNYYRAGAELDFMGMLDWTTLTPHARGTRRSDIIAEKFSGLTEITEEQLKYLMRTELAYTATYTMSDRYDEYCGEYDTYGDLTQEVLHNNPSAFSGIASEMTSKYMSRIRGITDTMQTATSTVYNIVDKTLNIVADEDGKEFALDIAGFDIGIAVSMAPCGGLMFDANQFFMKETPDGQPYVAMNSEQHVMDEDFLKRARTDGKSLYITDRYDHTLRYDPPIMDVTKEPAVYNEEKLVVTKNDASKVEYEAPLADAYIGKEDKSTYLEILKKDGTKVRFDSVDMRIVEFTGTGGSLTSDTSIDEIMAEPYVMWIGSYQNAYYMFDFDRKTFSTTTRLLENGMSAVENITSTGGTSWAFKTTPINPTVLASTELIDMSGKLYYKLFQYPSALIDKNTILENINKDVEYIVSLDGVELTISDYNEAESTCRFSAVTVDPETEQIKIVVLYPDENDTTWWRRKDILMVDGVLPIDFELDGLYLRNTYLYGNEGLFKYVFEDRRLVLARYKDQYYALTACYTDDTQDGRTMTFSRTFYDAEEDMWKVEEIYKRETGVYWDIRTKELDGGDKFIVKGTLDANYQFVVSRTQDITDAFYAHEHGIETMLYITNLDMYAHEVKTEEGYITYNLAQANNAPHFVTVKMGEDFSIVTRWKNVVTTVNKFMNRTAIERYLNNSFETTYELNAYEWRVNPATGQVLKVSGRLDYQGLTDNNTLIFGGTCTAFDSTGYRKTVDVIAEVINDATAHSIMINDADGEFVIVEATAVQAGVKKYNVDIDVSEGRRLLNAIEDNYPVALLLHETPTKLEETDTDTYMWFNGTTFGAGGSPTFHFLSYKNGRVTINVYSGMWTGKYYYPEDNCIYVVREESEYDDIPKLVDTYEAVYYQYVGNKEIVDQGETRLFTFEGELPYQQSYTHGGITTHVFSGDVIGTYASDDLVAHPYELSVLIDEGSTTPREVWTRIESEERKYYAFKQTTEGGIWRAVNPFDYSQTVAIDAKEFYYDILADNADVWLYFAWDTLAGADGHTVRVPALQWIKAENGSVTVKSSWDDIISKNRIILTSTPTTWSIEADTKPNLDNVTFTGIRTNTTWTWRKWDGTAVTERDIQRTCDLATHVGLHVYVTDEDGVARDYVMDFGNSEQISDNEYLYRFEGYTPEKHRLGDLTFIYNTDTRQTTTLDFSSRNVLDEVGAKFLITQPPTIESNTWIIEDKDGTEITVDDILAECEDGKSPRLWVYGLPDKLEPDMRLSFTAKHMTDVGEVYYFNGSGLNAVAEFTVTIMDDGTKLLAYNCNILNVGGGTKQYTSIHDSTKDPDKCLVFNSWKQMFTDLSNNTTCNMYVKGDDTIEEEGRALNYSGNTIYGTNQKIHTWKHADQQTVATLTAIENTVDHTLVSYVYEIKPIGDPVTIECKAVEATGALDINDYTLEILDETYDTPEKIVAAVEDGKNVTLHIKYYGSTYTLEWYLPFQTVLYSGGNKDKWIWSGNSLEEGIFGLAKLDDRGYNYFTFTYTDGTYMPFEGTLDLSGFTTEKSDWWEWTEKIQWSTMSRLDLINHLRAGTPCYLHLKLIHRPWHQQADHVNERYIGFYFAGYNYGGEEYDDETSVEWGGTEHRQWVFEYVGTVSMNPYDGEFSSSPYHQRTKNRISIVINEEGKQRVFIDRVSAFMDEGFEWDTEFRDIKNDWTVPTTKAVDRFVMPRARQLFITQPQETTYNKWDIRDPDGNMVYATSIEHDCLHGTSPRITVFGLDNTAHTRPEQDMDLLYTYWDKETNTFYFSGSKVGAYAVLKIKISGLRSARAYDFSYDYYSAGQVTRYGAYANSPYKKDDVVWDYNEDTKKYAIYFSLQDNNYTRPKYDTNHEWWQEISGGGGIEEWSATKTYAKDDMVWRYDEEKKEYLVYFSKKDNNLNHDPLLDVASEWWYKMGVDQGVEGVIGEVIWYGGNSAPTNFLLCDGSAVSRTTFDKLFSVIGTKFGAGDGSTTFNLPNLVDHRFIEGNTTAGATHDSAMPEHSHSTNGYCVSSSFSSFSGSTNAMPIIRGLDSNNNDGGYDAMPLYKDNGAGTQWKNDVDWSTIKGTGTGDAGSGDHVQPKSLEMVPCIRYARTISVDKTVEIQEAIEEEVKGAFDILETETWTFTLADGSTVTKKVYMGV